MDILKYLEDLYKYCQNNNLQFINLTKKQQKEHIKIMLKLISHKSH